MLLDGFDLGVGMLFGLTRDEVRRRAMLSAVSPIWDGNETWLVVTGVDPVGRISDRLRDTAVGLLSAAARHARGLDPARRRLRVPLQEPSALRWVWDIGFAGGSLAATFIQGMTVGALVEGLADRRTATMPAAISAG